jgi:hypothetical protein
MSTTKILACLMFVRRPIVSVRYLLLSCCSGSDCFRIRGAGSYHETLNLLLDLIDSGSAPGKPRKRQLSYHLLIEHARRVLGVKELTELRQTLLARNVQQSV